MSTLDLLTKAGVQVKTAEALEETTVDQNDDAAVEAGQDDDVVALDENMTGPPPEEEAEALPTYTEADVAGMKMKDVQDLYTKLEAAGVFTVENWGSLKLAEKKKALVDRLTEQKAGDEEEKVVASTTTSGKTIAKPKADKETKLGVASAEADILAKTATEIENTADAVVANSRIYELESEAAFTDIRLGGYLSLVQTKQWFGDHSTFKAYVEAETSMEYRKALYLISIYNSLVEANVPWELAAPVGWSKLKDLATILTEDNAKAWLEKAAGITQAQLAADIAVYKKELAAGNTTTSSAPPSDSTVKQWAVKLHEDQKDTVEAAVDKAMKEGNTDSKAVALEYIATDYLASTGKKSGTAAKAGPIKAADAVKVIEVKDFFVELAKQAGPEKRVLVAKAVLEAFDAVFPEVDITAAFPEVEPA